MRVKMESKKGKSAVCWIYQYSKKSLWLVILLALISGAIAGSFILLALVSSSLLDVATGVKEGRLGVQIFLIVCLILLQAVLNILSSNVRIHATTKIEMQIRQGIFAAVLKKQYQHVSKIHSGEILNRLTSIIKKIGLLLQTQNIPTILRQKVKLQRRLTEKRIQSGTQSGRREQERQTEDFMTERRQVRVR